MVSLQGESLPAALMALGRREFGDVFNKYARSGDQVDRTWRQAIRDRRIVLLVDGLDEAARDLPNTHRLEATAFTIAQALSDELTLVVATRPNSLPQDMPGTIFDVPPLDEETAVELVSPTPNRASLGVVRSVISKGLLAAAPVYLRFLPNALSDDDADWSQIDGSATFIRSRVVDSYLARASATGSPDTEECIRSLGGIAERLLSLDRHEASVSSLANEVSADASMGSMAMLELSERLGLSQLRFMDGTVFFRFVHPLLLAYFASRLLDRLPPSGVAGGIEQMVLKSSMPEALMAVEMFAARAGSRERATCARSLLVSATRNPHRDVLECVLAAARCGTSGSASDLRRPIATVAAIHWRMSHPGLREAVVRTMGSSNDDASLALVAAAQSDPVYSVRWAAAVRLSESGPAGFEFLRAQIVAYIESVEDRHAHALPHLVMQERANWYLPSLTDLLRSSSGLHRESRGLLERLVSCTRSLSANDELGSLGAESSLAQGFKLAAFAHPGLAVDPLAVEVAEFARFWYARVEALQAIAIRASYAADRRPQEVLLRRSIDEDPHPLVRGWSQTWLDALTRGNIESAVWLSEASMIKDEQVDLSDDALILFAETVLLLNLSEGANVDHRHRNAASDDVPLCFTSRSDRSRLSDTRGCASDCGFGLCPYVRTNERDAYGSIRGGFSPGFCRAVRYAILRSGPSPWMRRGRRAQARVWELMGAGG